MTTLDAAQTVRSFLSERGPCLRASVHARGLRDATGAVVMDLRHGKYYALNPVGAEVWSALEAGTDASLLLETLTARFEVEPSRLRADVGRLLEALVGRGLVVPAEPEPERCAPAAAAPELPRRAAAPRATPTASRLDRIPSSAVTAVAWAGLVAADLLIHVAGFRRLHHLARAMPIRSRGPVSPRTVADTRAAVDRAARLYFKRAWCLQRSFVTTVLLRARGVPAELVVGVRSAPFMAHAWVEVEGRVVNDRPSVRRFYREIERC